MEVGRTLERGADGQDGVELGGRGAGTAHLAWLHGAAGLEEFNRVGHVGGSLLRFGAEIAWARAGNETAARRFDRFSALRRHCRSAVSRPRQPTPPRLWTIGLIGKTMTTPSGPGRQAPGFAVGMTPLTLSPDAVLRLCSQPGFPDAMRASAAAAVNLYRGDRILNALLSDRARALFPHIVLYLHYAGPREGERGLTVGAMKDMCVRLDLCSPG
ncbi:MAG: hypothetical protein E6974_08655, partial [Veillonella sp.]|nr:hypothetical protein [Veillonella sp.]